MHDQEFIRKMALLSILLVIVLLIFFAQQRPFISNSPAPTPTPIAAASGNIRLTAPYNESSVGPNFLVKGMAKTPDTIVSIRVSNKLLGKIYYQGITQAYPPAAGQAGAFTAEVNLSTKDLTLRPNDKLTLEVFYISPDSRTERDMVLVPLYFSPELP